MAKKKAKAETTRGEPKSLVGKGLREEEKARMAHHRERSARKPIKFKSVKSDLLNPTIAPQDPDDPLGIVKMSEAPGTPDYDLQGQSRSFTGKSNAGTTRANL